MISADEAVFTIGTAARMLEVHPRTLRIYERENLIHPVRRGKWRYFTLDDIEWIRCLRSMIHDKGISIAGIKKLLRYTPCWNVADCPMERRKQCTAFLANGLVGLGPETGGGRENGTGGGMAA